MAKKRSPRIIRLVKHPDGSKEFVGNPVLYDWTMAEVLERGPLVIVGGDEYYAVDEVVESTGEPQALRACDVENGEKR